MYFLCFLYFSLFPPQKVLLQGRTTSIREQGKLWPHLPAVGSRSVGSCGSSSLGELWVPDLLVESRCTGKRQEDVRDGAGGGTGWEISGFVPETGRRRTQPPSYSWPHGRCAGIASAWRASATSLQCAEGMIWPLPSAVVLDLMLV